MTFIGFSTDDPIKLPRELFTDVLPAITQPAELKVTLHFFYLLRGSRRRPRMVEWSDFRGDAELARSLRAVAPLRPTDDVLIEGIEAAVRRGTLLHAAVPEGPRVGNWYLANTDRNRLWIARMVEGDIAWLPVPTPPQQRPTIFRLYEQNIGVLTPMLTEELKEAQERYPAAWLEDAIREAVRSNKRSWRYIRAVLNRWATNGRGPLVVTPDEDPSKYISGELSDIIKF
ncbi:MAG: DnaD domain protein [Chloroflexota bacterium]|nr:DnaD domain protein [Chloroflexota bacterium]PLS80819.1 MAG: primosomal replication protein N [Chloroflexota bacterium]